MLNVLDALFHTAHDFEGGVPALAQRMGMSASVLNKKVKQGIESHKPLLTEAVAIQSIARDYRVLHAMAFTLNHAAVEMPEIPDLSDMGIMDAYMEAAEADAIVVAEFRKAYADGQIDDKEFERIKAAQYEAIGKRLAWLAEIERITRMTPARGQS